MRIVETTSQVPLQAEVIIGPLTGVTTAVQPELSIRSSQHSSSFLLGRHISFQPVELQGATSRMACRSPKFFRRIVMMMEGDLNGIKDRSRDIRIYEGTMTWTLCRGRVGFP